MTDAQREKIRRFLNDESMAGAVRAVLLKAFLKPQKDRDVQWLAASRIAIDLLDDAWKDLNKLKADDGGVDKQTAQVGM